LQGDGGATLVIQKHLFALKGDSDGDWWHDQKIMSSPKCRSVEVINNPTRLG
jgi:hypothetical protein